MSGKMDEKLLKYKSMFNDLSAFFYIFSRYKLYTENQLNQPALLLYILKVNRPFVKNNYTNKNRKVKFFI